MDEFLEFGNVEKADEGKDHGDEAVDVEGAVEQIGFVIVVEKRLDHVED